MSRGLPSAREPDATPAGLPHLVVKRGHHGRYRFVLMRDGERIGGEVRIDAVGRDRDVLRTLALAKIAKLAEGLLAGVTARPSAGSGARSDDIACSRRTDSPDRAHPTIAGEGDHRGQV